MLSILWSVMTFIVAIAILIAVHEYGHYWVAKRCKVKVLKFSIGFGRSLWSRVNKAGTEFVIAAIPIGGFVKMVDEREGEVAEADLPYAFNRKSPLAKIAVASAGPLYNLFFAVIAYWFMFVIGITTVAPILGPVMEDSIAARAGFKQGQEIIAVDGEPTSSWKTVRFATLAHIGSKQQLKITVRNPEGGEQVIHTNITGWQLDPQRPEPMKSLGLTPYQPPIPALIGQLKPEGAAQKAGLQVGDKILAVDKTPIKDWYQLVNFISQNPGKTLPVQFQRKGQIDTIDVSLDAHQGKGLMGIYAQPITWPKDLLRKQRYDVIAAMKPALQETWEMTRLTVLFLGKMLTGAVSWQSISGPIGIAQGAGQSASIGLAYYLGFMALVSLSLAILNLLPIPVLDGGHIVYYLIELITGRSVSERVQAVAMKFGIMMLLGLMVVAFYNDIARF